MIIALAMMGIYRATKEQRQMLNAIQLQGAYGQDTKIIEGAQGHVNSVTGQKVP